jgi:hypothetical protein
MKISSTLLITTTLSVCAVGRVSGDPTPDNPGTPVASMDQSSGRQARADAWWTGPLLAASPATLPPGHFLIEPYVFDAIPRGHYANDGSIHNGPHENNFGTQSYILCGLIDTLSAGLIPRFGFNDWSQGRSSSGVRVGDLTLQAQYRLSQFEEGHWVPTTALVLGETLPTGKFDRLADRPADGLGSGVYSTTLSFYSQSFFWLPTLRIVRVRLDMSHTFPASGDLHDVSVYGTQQGFAGRVHTGASTVIDLAAEYSITRNWVLALDVVYEHDARTRVGGFNVAPASSGFGATPVALDSGAGHTWGLAPAIEYNFNSRVGVIGGAKLTAAGRNAAAVVIPVAAINIVI